jgi:integrase
MRAKSEPIKINFTKKSLEALSPQSQRRIVHDTQCRGLCLRIEASGRKSFLWRRKVASINQWKLIGLFPDLSVENARSAAGAFNTSFALWKSQGYEGSGPFVTRTPLTLGAVLSDYVERRVKSHAKNPERAADGTRWMFTKYLSAWENRRVSSIMPEDVLALHAKLGRENGPITANRTVAFVKRLVNWARDEMHYTGDNPVKRRFRMFKENSRERFLQSTELPRFFQALAIEPNRDLRDFVIIALMTGARRGDVLSMRWSEVDLTAQRWQVPASTKSGRSYSVELLEGVCAVLNQRRNDSEWVFPSYGRTGHVTGFRHGWASFMKRAGLSDFHVHDLRRTLASAMAAANVSLPIISRTMGHATPAVAAVYARLSREPVRNAMETAVKALLNAGGKS